MTLKKSLLTLFALCNISTLSASDLIRDPYAVGSLLVRGTHLYAGQDQWKAIAPATVFTKAGEPLGYLPKEQYHQTQLDYTTPPEGYSFRIHDGVRATFTATITSNLVPSFFNKEIRIEAELSLTPPAPAPVVELFDYAPAGLNGNHLELLMQREGTFMDFRGINWKRNQEVKYYRIEPSYNTYGFTAQEFYNDIYPGAKFHNFEPLTARDTVNSWGQRSCLITAKAQDDSYRPMKVLFSCRAVDSYSGPIEYPFKPYHVIDYTK